MRSLRCWLTSSTRPEFCSPVALASEGVREWRARYRPCLFIDECLLLISWTPAVLPLESRPMAEVTRILKGFFSSISCRGFSFPSELRRRPRSVVRFYPLRVLPWPPSSLLLMRRPASSPSPADDFPFLVKLSSASWSLRCETIKLGTDRFCFWLPSL